ncbi:class I SAM-dependent methyltransferase [Arenibaculum pallidiluteum]|uniref:class I SAM-dependent methyltransferase n=1 Tax=Arenibaculum pallidiluteum TaxID=2812559 RepID=UPI001A96FAC7|nr:class I SAM-dependent methyltransferase [Arenibaculum pallidiluteum]
MGLISDAARRRIMAAYREKRSEERLRFHYEVEKRLAEKLRDSTKESRSSLYRDCYEELFRTVGDHPQLTNKFDNDAAHVKRRLRLLLPMLRPDATLLEIGAGDCRLSIAAAPHVRKVIALDVAPAIMARNDLPANVEPCLSDGTSIPVPPGSVDIAYSDQLMEHLHPDDALEQLRNVFAALKPGGRYLCITPNRLSGPHDVSRYFEDVATGLHLREYTNRDLLVLMRDVGFREVRAVLAAKGRKIAEVPASMVSAVEGVFGALPRRLRSFAGGPLSNVLFGTRVVASK